MLGVGVNVLLAIALTVRAVRQGAVCLDLAAVADEPVETDETLDWPERSAWLAAVGRSPLVTEGVLVLEGSTLYLDRYHREERQVCAAFQQRSEARDDDESRGNRFRPPADPRNTTRAGRDCSATTSAMSTGRQGV